MRYLVSGGCGVIGSGIVHRLYAQGHTVSIIDPCEEPRNLWIWEHLPKPTEFQRCDVFPFRLEKMSRGMLEGILNGVDAVIHCAASTGIPYSMSAPDDDWERNVEGTRALLNTLRSYPRPTVVFSSIKPYWVPPRAGMGAGLDESALLSADEPYAASKAAQSMLAQAYARSYDLPIAIYRFSNLVGPAPCHGPRHGWATWFAISAAIGRPIEIQGTGQQSRDLLYVDDIFTACMLGLEHADKFKGEVFNVGGGRHNQVTVGAVASMLHELSGVEITKGPARLLDDDCVFVNTEKLRRETGWEPRVHALDAVREVYAWAKEHADELRKIYEGVK